MIVRKTSMNEMPMLCSQCEEKENCEYVYENLRMFLYTQNKYCPLIEIPDPKPEPTLTQHEYDLIQIIKKVYPDVTHMGITKDNDGIYILTDVEVEMPLSVGGARRYLYKEKLEINLFNKHKLPTLLSEFTNETSEKQYSINNLLSRPIRKE